MNKFELNELIACEDYNTIIYEKAKRRQNADYSFLQLSKFLTDETNYASFFMALMRTNDAKLESLNVTISIRTQASLRQLADTSDSEDLPVSCGLKEDSNSEDTTYGLNCLSVIPAKSKPLGMELSPDTPIDGLPYPADPDKIEVTTDYSNHANIKQLDSLAKISINKDNGIDGSDCEEFGNFTIYGKIEGNLEEINDKVIIPLSTPHSSGLCDVEIKGEYVTMYCHNKESFEASPIIIKQTTIKDLEAENRFILRSSIQKSFSCSISVSSTVDINENPQNNSSSHSIPSSGPTNSDSVPNSNSIPSSVPNSTDEDSEKTANNFFRFSKSKNGLSGGVIAALVIIIVALIAIIIGVYSYCRKTKQAAVTDPNMDSTFKVISKN